MENIYLVGFMGTGKSDVGKILARSLERDFLEMDELIEKSEKTTISQIFAEKGEAYFRTCEKKLLAELAQKSDFVISCGGGLICNQENADLLKKSGKVINLKASAKEIVRRTKHCKNRPLLNTLNPTKTINKLLAEREPFYSQAHIAIDTDKITAQAAANLIIQHLRD